MGGCNSLCLPWRESSGVCHDNHAHMLPGTGGGSAFKKPLGRNLSAAFSVGTADDLPPPLEKLNINLATEEELMTLPGVNRTTARAVVEYRRQIGGYRRVEDLALVSGVGAARLDAIRLEICVISGGNKASHNGTPYGSSSHLEASATATPVEESRRRVASRVDINAANVFQLMRVKGLGLTVAQHIVEFRCKRGPFDSTEDLLKVKGVTAALLGTIRHQIVVEGESGKLSGSDSGVALAQVTGGTALSALSGGCYHRDAASKKSSDDSLSASLGNGSMDGSTAVTAPLLGPACTEPTAARGGGTAGQAFGAGRPVILPPVLVRDGRPVVRVATWNIQQCSEDKVANPGVLEVVCMTILENGFGLIAFQELSCAAVLDRIRDELNNPTLAATRAWCSSGSRGRGLWQCAVSSKALGRMFQSAEYNGFLYDTQQNVVLKSSGILDPSTNGSGDQMAFVRRPFLGAFQVDKFDLVLMSVHLKAAGLGSKDLMETCEEAATVPNVVHALKRHLGSRESDVLILGDFNLSPENTEFDALRTSGFKNLIPSDLFTNISAKNLAGSQSYDNIWASRQAQQVHTGAHGVVRTGLSNRWIPNGWSWGGVVSDHCPVWAEFYVDQDLDAAVSLAAADLQGLILADYKKCPAGRKT